MRLSMERLLPLLVTAGCAMLLAACAPVPARPVAATPPVAAGSAPAAPAQPTDAGLPPVEDSLQYTRPPLTTAEIEAEPLFKVLSAEFAGQREQLDYAVRQYSSIVATTRDPALAERATRIAVFGRDDRAALAAARRWVELAPGNLEARQISAALHIRAGEVDLAVEDLEYFLAHDRSPEEAKLRTVANLLGQEENRATALAAMEQLIAGRTSEADTLLLYAVLALRAEDLESSRRAMNQLVQKANIKPAIALAYVTVLQRESKRDEALDFLSRALARTPGEFGLRLLYARILAESDRFEEARTEFLRLDQQQPGNAEVGFALGLLGIETQRLEEAEQRFRQLVDNADYGQGAHLYLGQIAELRQQPAAALAEYSKVTEGDNLLQARLRTAVVLGAQREVDEARAVLAAITAANAEERRQLVLVEAEILINNERLSEAMALFDRALNGSFDGALLYARAMLAERMNRLDAMETDLREIIAHEPDNAEALNALGYTLADRTDRLEEAHSFIARALTLTPDSFYVLDSMGWVLFRLGRLEDALPYLEKARALKNDPEVVAHLGEVLWHLGRQNDAREVWQGILKDSPDEPRIRQTMERLAR